jgi:hypothetical protein
MLRNRREKQKRFKAYPEFIEGLKMKNFNHLQSSITLPYRLFFYLPALANVNFPPNPQHKSPHN